MKENSVLHFEDAANRRTYLTSLRRIREVHQILDHAMEVLENTLAGTVSDTPLTFSPIMHSDDGREQDLRIAKSLYHVRRERSKVLPDRLLGEPAWDMLLDLYVAHCEARETSISSLCIAASVPGTTALRWIDTLEGLSFLTKHSDPNDGRRIFVQLSEKGVTAMQEFLRRAKSWI